MKESIKKRIEAVRCGKVPTGYVDTMAGILPSEWRSAPLHALSEVLSEQAGDREFETLSISAGIGFVNQAKKFGKELSGKQYAKYIVLRRGDFAYNKGNSKRYPQGCTYMLRERNEAAVPNVFECFRITKGHSEYYEQLFINGFMNKQLTRKINHGVRDDGLLNLTDEDFYSTVLPMPPIAEQQKIADILSTCDRAIELKQQLLEEKCRQKKWLMQKLLDPNSGSRLPDFEGEWSTGSFNDVCTFVNGRAYNQDELLEEGKYPVLRVGNLFTKSDWYYSDMELPAHMYIDNGDLIYAWSASFGPQIWVGEKVIFHYHIWKVLLSDAVCKGYLYQYFLYDVEQLSREQQGGTMSHITKESMEKRVCRYPTIAEQQKIAEVLDAADREVALAEADLEFWQLKKKSLMQLLLTGLVRVNA